MIKLKMRKSISYHKSNTYQEEVKNFGAEEIIIRRIMDAIQD
ncbi:hypothetical protein P0092_14920 [Ruminiclostridium papyrosolvens DSM 2782]|nr:hypothetical protein [Ruminiclostridium papyrosolvens]WES33046.1 hypothetical protein P0092_14920 [Ruminiclostridium papyrosolvens DSM 2782]